MNFKRLFKITHFVIICICLILNFGSISVKASSSDIGFTEDELKSDEDYIVESTASYLKIEYSGTEVKTVPGTCSNYFSIVSKKYSGVTSTYLAFKYVKFSGLSESDKKFILSCIKKSELYESFTNSTKSSLIGMISSTANMSNSTALESVFGEVKPDLSAGYKMYRPFNSWVRLFTALGAIIASICLTASFVLDLFYMNISYLQTTIEDSKLGKFLSKSAKHYVQGENSGESIITIALHYFKDRVITCIIYGVLLVYIFEGKFVDLIQALTSLARGFQ